MSKQKIDKSNIKNYVRKRSCLRGALFAGGSVNSTETSLYHLEIFSLYEEHSADLTALMNQYELNSKQLERKKGYISYLKEAEKISDFLSLIGGYQALLKFEDRSEERRVGKECMTSM